jgi:hypothetical protein
MSTATVAKSGGMFRLEAGLHYELEKTLVYDADGEITEVSAGDKVPPKPQGGRIEQVHREIRAGTPDAVFFSNTDLDKKHNQYDKQGRCVSRKFTRLGIEEQQVAHQTERIEELESRNLRLDAVLDTLTYEQLISYAEGQELDVHECKTRDDVLAVIRA